MRRCRTRCWGRDYCSDMFFFFFQAEDGIRDLTVTGVQTCALPISLLGERRADDVPLFEVSSANAMLNRRSEEHTSELQSQSNLVCRLLLEKKKKIKAIAVFYVTRRTEYDYHTPHHLMLMPQ